MQDSDRKAVGIEKELPVIIPFDDIADLVGEGITTPLLLDLLPEANNHSTPEFAFWLL